MIKDSSSWVQEACLSLTAQVARSASLRVIAVLRGSYEASVARHTASTSVFDSMEVAQDHTAEVGQKVQVELAFRQQKVD